MNSLIKTNWNKKIKMMYIKSYYRKNLSINYIQMKVLTQNNKSF